MAKKLLIIALVLALTAALVGPASADKKKKKKKKGPKPYVSETITIDIGHPAFHGASGTLLTITAQEFLQSCSIPSSNGLDAYVFEVPEEYLEIDAVIRAVGDSAPAAGYDLDIYMFDAECSETFFSNSPGTDESGLKPAGTTYVLLHNYQGDPVDAHYELEVAK